MLPEERAFHRLRQALREQALVARAARLEAFRRTGRALRVYTLAQTGEGETAVPALTKDPSPRQRWLSRALLALEVLAALALMVVVAQSARALQALNAAAREALVQPTLTPTPWVQAIVLPGGHTPPTAPGGPQPNLEEIPAHLRPYVQVSAPVAFPTPSPEHPIRVRIPAIGVDAPVVMGDGWEQLKKGVGWHIGSGLPGRPGNLVLTAHNDVYGEIFRDLDKLRPGDRIYVHTQRRVYTYVVEASYIVQPTEVEWMAPTQEPVVTLISCYPYMVDTHRIIVRGRLQSTSP